MSIWASATPCRYTDSDFSFNVWSYNNITLPYRETVITAGGTQQKPILVIYLHGGLKRGSDNVRQMNEDAIYTIADYLCRNCINAFMIVPQCPDSLTWGVQTNEIIKNLVDEYMNKGKVDPDRIYLVGGSMGGTGAWKMASAYPYLFAAVMPVAGNPDTVDAALLANTPVCTVMGTGDKLMDIAPVISFLYLAIKGIVFPSSISFIVLFICSSLRLNSFFRISFIFIKPTLLSFKFILLNKA